MSNTAPEGGGPRKTGQRPLEQAVSFPTQPTVHGDLEADRSAVRGPGGQGLDGLPISRRSRWWAKGQAKRHVQARALHEASHSGAPRALGIAPASTADSCRSPVRPEPITLLIGHGFLRLRKGGRRRSSRAGPTAIPSDAPRRSTSARTPSDQPAPAAVDLGVQLRIQ